MAAQPRGWLGLPLNSILSNQETTFHDGACGAKHRAHRDGPFFAWFQLVQLGRVLRRPLAVCGCSRFSSCFQLVHCFWMVQCKPASHVPGGSPRPVDVGRHWVSAAWLDHVAEPMFHAARTWVTRPGSTLRRLGLGSAVLLTCRRRARACRRGVTLGLCGVACPRRRAHVPRGMDPGAPTRVHAETA